MGDRAFKIIGSQLIDQCKQRAIAIENILAADDRFQACQTIGRSGRGTATDESRHPPLLDFVATAPDPTVPDADDERDDFVSAGPSATVSLASGEEIRPAMKPPAPMRTNAVIVVREDAFIGLRDGLAWAAQYHPITTQS